MEIIEINTEYIKLDQLLKFAGIVGNGSDAKMVILDGMVKVNGEICQARNKKIRPEDEVEVEDYGKLIVKGL
ncbi:RNA-binding S4 domain-containing protein [Eubacteriaceae bacterium ES3]|nr:RNA-binding S4 domain-containing protein [Eubacteriaceae bacterium ES3]